MTQTTVTTKVVVPTTTATMIIMVLGSCDGGSDTSDDNDGLCDFAAGNCSSALRKFPYEWTLSFYR